MLRQELYLHFYHSFDLKAADFGILKYQEVCGKSVGHSYFSTSPVGILQMRVDFFMNSFGISSEKQLISAIETRNLIKKAAKF